MSGAPGGGPERGRRVARTLGILLAGETIAQALGFVAAAYLARALGPSGFGVWVFAAAVVTYLTMLVEAGTDTWGIREISAAPSRLRETLDAVLTLRAALAALAAAALLAGTLAFVSSPERRIALLFGVTSLAAIALQTHWALRALDVVVPVAAAAVLQRGAMLVLALLLVRAPGDAPRVTLWQGVSELLGALLLLAALGAHAGAPLRRARLALARRAAAESWPIAVARGLRGLTYTIAVAVLARFWPNATVGEYGAAYRIPLAVMALHALFGAAVAPAVARACAAGRADAAAVGAASVRVLAVVLFPVLVGGTLLAGPLVSLVFGARFAGAVAPFRVLLAAAVIAGFTDLLRRVLHFSHRQRHDMWYVAASVALSVALNAGLARAHGAIGAASAAVVAEAVLLGLVAWGVRRAGIPVAYLAPLARPALAAGAMGAAVWALRALPLALSVPLGAAVYAAALALSGDRTLAELHRLDVPVRAADTPDV